MLSFGTMTLANNKNGVNGPSSLMQQRQERRDGDVSCLPPISSRPPPLALESRISTPATSDGRHHYSSTSDSSSYDSLPISTISSAGSRREQQSFHTSDSGSPVKQRSPLRQSVSYDDYNSPDSPILSFRGSIDLANSIIGRSNMSYTGDRKGSRRVSTDRSPAWHKGQVEDSPSNSLQSTPTRQTRQTTPATNPDPQTPKAASPSGSSRFAFFSSSMSALRNAATSATSSPVAVPHDDELMNMDIHSVIQGQNGDTFSPAAYKNLQMTATGLLQKFQTAYQQRTIAYYELKSERNAQSEEKDEADTRMHHLKMQLEGMARRAAEQEAVMQSLMDELAHEKRLRPEERQLSEKGASVSEGSSVSEDLGAEEDQQRRKWRRSTGTAKSDLVSETDDESIEEASVFSRSRSPTIATAVTEMSHVEPQPMTMVPLTRTPTSASTTPRNSPSRPGQPAQMSAFQKLFKGISGDSPRESSGVSSCLNCEGQAVSVAWDTVNLLKDENKGLKERVGELETAVEGAMDVVNGVAMRER